MPTLKYIGLSCLALGFMALALGLYGNATMLSFCPLLIMFGAGVLLGLAYTKKRERKR